MRSPGGNRVFAALSDDQRQRILFFLEERGEAPVHVIAGHLNWISQPTVSRHLMVLLNAELVRFVRRGRENLYSLNPDALALALAWFGRFGACRALLDETGTRMIAAGSPERNGTTRQGAIGNREPGYESAALAAGRSAAASHTTTPVLDAGSVKHDGGAGSVTPSGGDQVSARPRCRA